MKKLLLISLVLVALISKGQDQTQIIVNLSDNAKLQYNGVAVKMKAVVVDYSPVVYGTKDFRISVTIKYYINNAGAYGGLVTADIEADQTLSASQKEYLLDVYKDRSFSYNTMGNYVNAQGDVVPFGTVGSVPEYQYWQSFKL